MPALTAEDIAALTTMGEMFAKQASLIPAELFAERLKMMEGMVFLKLTEGGLLPDAAMSCCSIYAAAAAAEFQALHALASPQAVH